MMVNYTAKTDCEINMLVNKIVANTAWTNCDPCYGDTGLHWDYCNNPSDAWPIILKNDIMLNPNCADGLWKAEQGFREKPTGFYDVAVAYHKNPLRAAMIVYLMIQGV